MAGKSDNWVGIGIALASCALVFGILGGFASRYFGPETQKLSYAEFVAILLSAISVLLTILGIIIAIVALFGWNAISKKVEERVSIDLQEHANSALESFLRKDLKPTDKLFQLFLEKMELAVSVSKDELDMVLQQTEESKGSNKSDGD